MIISDVEKHLTKFSNFSYKNSQQIMYRMNMTSHDKGHIWPAILTGMR